MSKTKPEIEAIFFDLGNVLLFYDPKIAAKRLSKECGVSVPRLWKFFLTDPLEKIYTRGEVTSRDFFKQACKSLKVEIPYTLFRQIWNEIFWENEGIEKVLWDLKKNYPLYLISNTNDMHWEYIKKHYPHLLEPFNRLFPSHKVGARKPESAIYERVLEKVKLPPEKGIFIDDVMDFVRGARKVGMHSIQYKNTPKLLQDLSKLGVKV